MPYLVRSEDCPRSFQSCSGAVPEFVIWVFRLAEQGHLVASGRAVLLCGRDLTASASEAGVFRYHRGGLGPTDDHGRVRLLESREIPHVAALSKAIAAQRSGRLE